MLLRSVVARKNDFQSGPHYAGIPIALRKGLGREDMYLSNQAYLASPAPGD